MKYKRCSESLSGHVLLLSLCSKFQKVYSKHLPKKLMQLFSTNITICFMIMKPVVLVLDTFLEILKAVEHKSYHFRSISQNVKQQC